MPRHTLSAINRNRIDPTYQQATIDTIDNALASIQETVILLNCLRKDIDHARSPADLSIGAVRRLAREFDDAA